jgi:hypothetical protein
MGQAQFQEKTETGRNCPQNQKQQTHWALKPDKVAALTIADRQWSGTDGK